MQQSAIEKEFLNAIKCLRSWIRGHDRGVIIGLMMSIIPIPPITVAGLILGFANLVLLKAGKLDPCERKVIRNGIVIGVLICALGIFLSFYLYDFTAAFHWRDFFGFIKENILDSFNYIKQQFNLSDPPEQVRREII